MGFSVQYSPWVISPSHQISLFLNISGSSLNVVLNCIMWKYRLWSMKKHTTKKKNLWIAYWSIMCVCFFESVNAYTRHKYLSTARWMCLTMTVEMKFTSHKQMSALRLFQWWKKKRFLFLFTLSVLLNGLMWVSVSEMTCVFF